MLSQSLLYHVTCLFDCITGLYIMLYLNLYCVKSYCVNLCSYDSLGYVITIDMVC